MHAKIFVCILLHARLVSLEGQYCLCRWSIQVSIMHPLKLLCSILHRNNMTLLTFVLVLWLCCSCLQACWRKEDRWQEDCCGCGERSHCQDMETETTWWANGDVNVHWEVTTLTQFQRHCSVVVIGQHVKKKCKKNEWALFTLDSIYNTDAYGAE